MGAVFDPLDKTTMASSSAWESNRRWPLSEHGDFPQIIHVKVTNTVDLMGFIGLRKNESVGILQTSQTPGTPCALKPYKRTAFYWENLKVSQWSAALHTWKIYEKSWLILTLLGWRLHALWLGKRFLPLWMFQNNNSKRCGSNPGHPPEYRSNIQNMMIWCQNMSE